MSTTDGTILCPRCERNRFTPYGGSAAPQGSGINEFAPPPALSRLDNATYICSYCGSAEAARDLAGWPPIPPSDWPVE
jgi:RNA polymerase subunit RPABC4/transcription elongation factor Spt4